MWITIWVNLLQIASTNLLHHPVRIKSRDDISHLNATTRSLSLSLCRNVAYFQSTCYKTKAFTSSACNQPPCSHWFTFPYFTFKIKMKIEIKIKLIELFHFIFHEIWIRIEHEFNYTHVILTGRNSDDSSKLWIFTQKWDNSLLQLKWHFRVENCHLKFAQSL